jgi:hypothetical protein
LWGLQDAHAFSYQAMGLALTGPQALQDKMETVLAILNAPAQRQVHQQCQQQQLGQQEQQQQQQQGQSVDSLQDEASTRVFSLSDVQAAARRDHLWLGLSRDTIQQRLLGAQQALGVSLTMYSSTHMQTA